MEASKKEIEFLKPDILASERAGSQRQMPLRSLRAHILALEARGCGRQLALRRVYNRRLGAPRGRRRGAPLALRGGEGDRAAQGPPSAQESSRREAG